MVFDRLTWGIAQRAIALAFALNAAVLVWLHTEAYVALLLATAATLLMIVELWRHASVLSRTFTRALEDISFDEPQTTFDPRHTQLPASVCHALNRSLSRFKDARGIQAQSKALHLGMLEQMSSALFTVSDAGVAPQNAAARRIGYASADHIRAFANTAAPNDTRTLECEILGSTHSFQARAGEIRIGGNTHRFVTLADIGSELQSAELTAYRNVARILSHELGNSLTPIASLAETITQRIDALKSGFDETALQDIDEAIRTIANRSRGLVRFSDTVRQLLRLGQPQRRNIELSSLFDRLRSLVQPELSGRRVSFSTNVIPSNATLNADADLLEHALLNLIKNASDALSDQPGAAISIRARPTDAEHIELEVSDNGPGIPETEVANIFVPFFSTKKNGAGVGLSLVREIVHAHGGRIALASSASGGARFVLTLPRG